MSTFTYRVATPDDGPGITEAYMSAFAKSYITIRCFPRSSPATHAGWAQSLAGYFTNPDTTIIVATDDTTTPPTVVGFAKWSAPQREDSRAEHEYFPSYPPEGDVELATEFFDGIARKRKEIMGERKYWHLHMLAVRPDYQGRGAAGPLIKWGAERADEDGLPCYLDASPMAKAIYERYGFKVADTLVFGGGELVETMMVREAAS
ncbi:uncharacterized protein DNG_08783 [Cephalotrichum gorgonifer]|uniref:N-acetyltransferase domain-containing protein n=1 Tax=Cephalotrichum gorgonifer TaxID=2041049 RepID=A0AAE8N646_9PEZI|nr:uncharacterized protein DNG_08783 [Cephalotrichum gorgonifer]